MNTSRYATPAVIKSSSTEKLLDLWETTDALNANNPEVPIVRGWLMDEIERRNPEGFDAWLEQDAPEDTDLRRFILG